MPALKNTKTWENLKEAFAGESQANRRYLYFAQKADVEGYNDVAAVFRSTAEGETGHAHGHLEYLEEVGDPATGEPIGATDANLKASIAGETHEYTDMYPGMAQDRARRRLRRNRRLVRDLGEGREVPCRPLPEGPRRPQIRRRSVELIERVRFQAACPAFESRSAAIDAPEGHEALKP